MVMATEKISGMIGSGCAEERVKLVEQIGMGAASRAWHLN